MPPCFGDEPPRATVFLDVDIGPPSRETVSECRSRTAPKSVGQYEHEAESAGSHGESDRPIPPIKGGLLAGPSRMRSTCCEALGQASECLVASDRGSVEAHLKIVELRILIS
jgi:hypothetical protein